MSFTFIPVPSALFCPSPSCPHHCTRNTFSPPVLPRHSSTSFPFPPLIALSNILYLSTCTFSFLLCLFTESSSHYTRNTFSPPVLPRHSPTSLPCPTYSPVHRHRLSCRAYVRLSAPVHVEGGREGRYLRCDRCSYPPEEGTGWEVLVCEGGEVVELVRDAGGNR